MAADGSLGLGGTRVFVLTVSDGVASGTRDDRSGTVLETRLTALGARVDRGVVMDDAAGIGAAVLAAARSHQLVLTTGGTGLTPRDVTPQATRAILDQEIPGIGEAMRAAGRRATPLADLSRAVAGMVGTTLVINLPGSPTGALEALNAVEPILAHAIETLAGPHDHDAARASRRVTYDRPEEDAS
ncbi:MAG: MogA/MoaB family molybdenum cofactor biosynthesis protein [Chloroflexi bacterium]|nr:MogA/MoaB family molybdenum cofactor biosynthesis protein [Chloroflexota bacterium]